MPDERDSVADAEHEAELAAAFYDRLLRTGTPERVAAELTTGYVIGRQRQQRDERAEWDA